MINSYIPEEINLKSADYELIFGAGELTKSFNWKEYLPPRERQWWIPFCVSFSRLDCAEAVARREDLELNLSDRRLAVESGTTKNGNTMDAVSDWFRKIGTDKEEDTPITPKMISDGWNEWDNIFKLPEAGKRYVGGNHSWVNTKAGMIDALNYSPLQIAVGETNFNWEREGEVQVPTKDPEYYHCVLVYHIDEQGRYLVRDSIGKEFKILHKDYPIKWCKSFRDLSANWKETMANNYVKIIKDKNSKAVGFWIPALNEQALETLAMGFCKPLAKTADGNIDWDKCIEGELMLNQI